MQSHSSDQKTVQQFRTIRNRQVLVVIPLAVIFLVLAWFGDNLKTVVVGIHDNVIPAAAFLVIVGMAIFSLINWRCPSCKSYLGRSFNPQSCSECGAKLR